MSTKDKFTNKYKSNIKMISIGPFFFSKKFLIGRIQRSKKNKKKSCGVAYPFHVQLKNSHEKKLVSQRAGKLTTTQCSIRVGLKSFSPATRKRVSSLSIQLANQI